MHRLFAMAYGVAVVAAVGSCSPSLASTKVTSAQFTPDVEAVVQAQVNAYNRRDIDAFLSYFAPDIRIYTFPDSLLFSGRDTLRVVYGGLFARAKALKADVTKRTVQGRYVIDQETTHGMSVRGPVTGVAIYEVRNGAVSRVWFLD